jgi:CTP:molybdopterin cytidylyltransferase MocA
LLLISTVFSLCGMQDNTGVIRHSHAIAGIILAAGESRRFGSPKQTAILGGESLLHRAVRAAMAACLDPVIVVLGEDARTMAATIADIDNAVIVINEAWRSGQSSSLRTGVQEAERRGCDAIAITLVDQPLVEQESLLRLISMFDDGHRVVAAEYNDVLGVPALIGAEFFQELLMIDGDQGAGKWIRAREKRVTPVPMPEAAIDIDSPDDLEKLRRSARAE